MRILRSISLGCAFASLSIVAVAQSEDFPARAAAELASLHKGVSLAAWMRAHPNDAPVLYSHRHWDWGNWIVHADNSERSGSRQPAGTDVVNMRRRCLPLMHRSICRTSS